MGRFSAWEKELEGRKVRVSFRFKANGSELVAWIVDFLKEKIAAWMIKGAIEKNGLRRKLAVAYLNKWMEGNKMNEKINAAWAKLSGFKIYIVAASGVLAAMVGLMGDMSPLMVDGFQIQDLFAVSHSENLKALQAWLAVAAGRSTIQKVIETMKDKPEVLK